jgi:hypothetical protein
MGSIIPDPTPGRCNVENRIFANANLDLYRQIVIQKPDIMQYLDDDKKNDFLLNLFAAEQNINRMYLHTGYINNDSFCTIFNCR